MTDLITAEPEVQQANPLLLLERAVEKGMDPAQLKALVDLHEQWRAARAAEAFAESMNACQSEMPIVVRDALNQKTESKFARLETVQQIAKPVYTRHGFALSFAEEDSNTQGFKRTICDVRHRGGHCVRYHLDLPRDGIGPKGNPIGGMNAVQGCISTGSYGQRVLTCQIFNITVADTDSDGCPAANDNPELRPGAPLAPNRSQRNAPHPNAAHVDKIKKEWGRQTREANEVVDGEHFWAWFRKVTGSTGQPHSPEDWNSRELHLCRSALGLVVEETT